MARSRIPTQRDQTRSTGTTPARRSDDALRAPSPRETGGRGRTSTPSPTPMREKSVEEIAFSTGRVLALLGDPIERLLVDERLSASGELDVLVVPELALALTSASAHFDVAVVDLACIAPEPPAAVRELVESLGETPIVVVGDAGDHASASAALDSGAEDFVPRALLGSDALLQAIRRGMARDTRRHDLDRLAFTDPLTGILNRRGFTVIATRALEAAERLGSTFTLLFLDIDDLEQINTAYGHSAGDAALREVARILAENVRPMDIVARVGDDEFCIALTDGSPPAVTVAQRLGRCFDEHNRSQRGSLLSLTLGVTEADEWRNPTLDHLLAEAAARMLAAKITTPIPRRA